jgi:membrane-associated protease RseP (regulator of RpoE activity)
METDMKSRYVTIAMLLGTCGIAWGKDRVDYPIRGVLGIETVTLTTGLEDVVGAPAKPGAWVTSPSAGVGAAPAHGHNDTLWPPIFAGDLIVGVDGQAVWSAEDLDALLADRQVGEVVRIALVREGREKTVSVKLKKDITAIYLPARTCAIPTTGTLARVNIAPFFFFGLQATARGASELAGQCPAPVEACSQLRLVQQTKEATIVEMNGFKFQIDGNWTGHTHLQQAGCKDEQKRIAEETASRAMQKEASIAERAHR